MGDTKTFLMMGAPGSGKGTQATLLAQKIGGRVYSSGARLRGMVATGSYFGKRAQEVMTKGDLMPVWVSQYLFEEALVGLEPTDAIVFEGSCRILEEAKRFHEVAQWLERQYTAIYLEASEESLKERLLKRQGIEGRADDADATLAERFEKFYTLTLASIEYFKKEGTLIVINGEQSIEAVHMDILKALKLS
ncbi:MAG: nucleoside monophosphate kinase [bacterium]|nr:nucleoside monophosphate kinase [bacterium]